MTELFETVGDVERRALAKLTEMTRPINTTTAPALPDEMVTRATKAMLRADGWTAQEIADQCKKGEGTTLRPFTAEILAEVALTAAGVPGLLAEVERLREFRKQIEADHRAVMAEECAPDERHCSCVPHLRAECDLRLHQLLTCGVIATHPDPNLSRTGAYGNKWDTQQSEFRPLRRDSLCPSGAAFVSTMPAPSSFCGGACCEILFRFRAFHGID